MPVTNYEIVVGPSYELLQQKVQNLLDNGYRIFGGVWPRDGQLYQIIIKGTFNTGDVDQYTIVRASSVLQLGERVNALISTLDPIGPPVLRGHSFFQSMGIVQPAEATGESGNDGRELEIQVTDTAIQTRMEGGEWSDLIQLSQLHGADGKNGEYIELRSNGGYIQMSYESDSEWRNLVALADITGPAGRDARDVEFTNDGTNISWRYVGDTEWSALVAVAALKPPAATNGTNGVDGKTPEFRVSGQVIQYRYTGEALWQNLFNMADVAGADGQNGTNGRDIELNNSGTAIQWRYRGDASWNDLVALTVLTGAAGPSVELRTTATQIQWRIAGSNAAWANLVALAALQGPEGDSIQLRVDNGYIQWQYLGEAGWLNLISVASLVGPNIELRNDATSGYIQWRIAGSNTWNNLVQVSTLKGDRGADGPSVEIRVDSGYIQWRVVGTAQWTNILTVASLVGATGPATEMQIAGGQVQWRPVGTQNWNNLIAVSSLVGATGTGLSPGLPVVTTVALGGAYQAAATGFLSVMVEVNYAVTLASTMADTVELWVGPDNTVAQSASTTARKAASWRSGLTGITVSIGMGASDRGQMATLVKAGQYYAVRVTEGTRATIKEVFFTPLT